MSGFTINFTSMKLSLFLCFLIVLNYSISFAQFFQFKEQSGTIEDRKNEFERGQRAGFCKGREGFQGRAGVGVLIACHRTRRHMP